MAPDEKDLEIEVVNQDDQDNESASLSAGGRGFEDDIDSDLDVDITGDEAIDFADEEDAAPKSGGGKLKKMVAPALVLVVAAGVGGYIIMNPQIIGQLTGGGDAAPVAQSVASAQPEQAPQDITEASAEQSTDMFSDSLPQPTVNQNEVPRAPDEQPAQQDITELAAETPAEPAPEVAAAEPVAAPVPEESAPAVTELASIAPPAEQPAFPDEAVAEPVVNEEAAEPALEVEGEGEQGSADESPDDADAAAAAAEEPSAEPPVEETVEVNISSEVPVETAAAELTPIAEETIAPPPADESFEIAQTVVPATADESQPPPMPEQISAPAPAAEAPAAVAEAPASNPSESAAGTAAKPIKPTDGPDPEVYYDGRIPTGPMADDVGPRKIDPVMEPASQLVVVKKTHEPMNMEAILASANRALDLKRYDSAVEMFDQLYAKNPRDPRILMGRAVALQNAGRSEAAIKTYEELLDINPNNADAMLNMLGLLRQQYPSVALRRLIDLHDRHPNNAGVAAQIGVTQADLGQPQEAMRYLGIASTLEPKNAQHIFNMAIIADRSGDTKGAIKYYEQALELDAVYASGRSLPRETVYDRLSTLRRR